MPEFSDTLSFLLCSKERALLRDVCERYRFRLVSAVFFRNRPPWQIGWRTCPDHFFLFPTLGRFKVRLDDATFEVKPGEFLMLPEGVRHHLQITEGSRHLHQISVHAHILDRRGCSFLRRATTAHGLLMHQKHDLETLRRLVHLLPYEPLAAQGFAESFLKQLLAFQVQRGVAFEDSGPDAVRDPRVLHALQQIETDYASAQLNVEFLADGAGITPTQFRKLFRRDTGTSPKAYLNRFRLRQAQLLLCQTTLTVKEIAAACGFSADHYFHLVFRASCHCTPSEYRQRALTEV